MDGANRCLVAEETRCNFFVLVNGYCQLGKFNLDDNQYVGNSLNDSTIYLRSDLGESNSLSISLSNLKYENFYTQISQLTSTWKIYYIILGF